jgi:Phytochelatin synthase
VVTEFTSLDNRCSSRWSGLDFQARWRRRDPYFWEKPVQRPITKVRALVEPLEARCVPSAIGFHDAIRPHLGSGHDASTARSTIQDAAPASSIGPTAHLKSIPLSDSRVPAALVKEARDQSETLSSGDPIPLDSDLGMRMLDQSQAKRNFIALISNYTTQINATYCSIASTAMVFNAGGVPRPGSTENPNGHYFDQVNLINEVKDKFDVGKVLKAGVTLDTYGQFLSFFPVQATITHAADTTLDAFRNLAIATLERPHEFLVVNYYRPDVGQAGGGHFSPVAAYDAVTDRFLILDVTRGKYPPVWVPASRLFSAMQAVDSDSGLSRGFVVIKTS